MRGAGIGNVFGKLDLQALIESSNPDELADENTESLALDRFLLDLN